MPLVKATISGQVTDPALVGATAARRVTLIVRPATVGYRITYPGGILAGSTTVTVDEDGTATVALPTTDQPGILPAGWQWEAILTLPGVQTYAYFDLTDDTTWDALGWDTSTAPVTPSQVSLAQAAQTAAQTAATAAEAAQAAAEAVPTTTDGLVSGLLDNDSSASRVTADALYTGKGGATKTDGQNVLRLRRPTLTVDRMWPNEFGDHQIVWVDETLKVAYAIGLDNRLRKSTWTDDQSQALRWSVQVSEAADGFRWCDDGVFMRLPTTNTLLLQQVAIANNQTTLLRSTNDGTSWTTVWTAPSATVRLLGPQSLVRDGATGYLYLTEYTTDVTVTAVSIWRSTDDGATWSVWKSYPRADANPGTPGSIRHWHAARYDSVSQRVYFFAGDTNDDAGIWRVNAAGTDIEPVILNSQIAAQFPDTPTCARCVDAMFFSDYIAWATDGGGGQPHVNRIARSQIGQTTPTAERIAAIDNTGWFTVKTSADGSVWVCATSGETGVVGWTPDPGTTHLYAVSNNGANVDEVAIASTDGAALGIPTISGLGGASGSGDAFYLRAHRYQTPYSFGQLTSTSMSAFQLRAHLGNAVVALPKPARKPFYNKETHAVGPISVPASSTVTWGGTRVPRRTPRLVICNFGARAIVGSFTAAKVEVWNKTTSTKITEWGGQSYVYDGKADTDVAALSFLQTAADQIEFKVTNTTATDITAAAFVSFAWSF